MTQHTPNTDSNTPTDEPPSMGAKISFAQPQSSPQHTHSQPWWQALKNRLCGNAHTPTESEPREVRTLMANVLQTSAKDATDVMVPRGEIIAFDAVTPLVEICQQVTQHPYSRYPIYRNTIDNVVGFVHIKDVLTAYANGTITPQNTTATIKTLMRDVMFISPGQPALDVIVEMRMQGNHFAIVVDEYGGVDGLVTLTDLVAEIVGDIDDEHAPENAPQLSQNPDGTLTAHARYEIETFADEYGEILSPDEQDEDIETLAGLVFYLIGRVPARGEIVKHAHSGIEFEVLDADPRRIRRLRLRNVPPKKQS